MRGATSKKPGKRTEEPAPRPEYGRGTGVPNPIDVEVGGRIRTRRLLLGMNQQALADALDLTFQQVQKYEHGANRVSASRLAAMAKILVVPISYFFADLQSDGAEPTHTELRGFIEGPAMPALTETPLKIHRNDERRARDQKDSNKMT